VGQDHQPSSVHPSPSGNGSTCAGRPGPQWAIEAQMMRTPTWTVACLPVEGALPEHIVEILIGAQSTRREAGVKHRTVSDVSFPPP
jgi:hypothetical protein